MNKVHVVKQGECLSTICAKHGWSDWRKLYDAPENAELKKLRPNPNVLYPGDVVAIPQPPRQPLKLSTGQVHTIVVKRPKARLRVKLMDSVEGAGANLSFRIYLDDAPSPVEGKLSGGLLDVPVPLGVSNAKVILLDEAGVAIDEIEMKLGHKDPVETMDGAVARLQTIGIQPHDDSEEGIGQCLRLFQQRFGLPADGLLNDATKTKLEELAGC